jgi:hypothetical protein
MWAGGFAAFDALANDDDPAGLALDACRGDADNATAALPMSGELLVIARKRATGTHHLSYDACNQDRLAASTLTVTVRHAARVRAGRVAGKVGYIRLTNPNPATVSVDYGDFRSLATMHSARLRAHATRTVRVHWRYVDWAASIGSQHGDAGHGVVRDVRISARDARVDRSKAGYPGDPVLIAAARRNLPTER